MPAPTGNNAPGERQALLVASEASGVKPPTAPRMSTSNAPYLNEHAPALAYSGQCFCR